MNDIFIIDDAEQASEKLHVSPVMLTLMKSISGWAMTLAITGFVFLAYSVVRLFAGNMPGTFVFGTLIGAAIYFFPVLYLFKFARGLKLALKNGDEIALIEAFKYFKSHYKFVGIATIVTLSVLFIFLVATVISVI